MRGVFEKFGRSAVCRFERMTCPDQDEVQRICRSSIASKLKSCLNFVANFVNKNDSGPSMTQRFDLTFTGKLAPDNKISARTLAHSLQHVQRAIDKLVIYEQRGAVRKYATLANTEYAAADLIVQQFEQGSIRIPLLNDAYEWLGEKLSGILHDPYEEAASEQALLLTSLDAQVPSAVNRAFHKKAKGNTQSDLIEDEKQREHEYYISATLQEINQLVSPLRSSTMTDNETITFSMGSAKQRRDYRFDRRIAKRFHQVVSAKQFGPETLYTGTLNGLNEVRVGKFPYKGQFKSEVTNQEMALWIPTEESAQELNKFNISDTVFSFWASPITTYGVFDEYRGDLVFLAFPHE